MQSTRPIAVILICSALLIVPICTTPFIILEGAGFIGMSVVFALLSLMFSWLSLISLKNRPNIVKLELCLKILTASKYHIDRVKILPSNDDSNTNYEIEVSRKGDQTYFKSLDVLENKLLINHYIARLVSALFVSFAWSCMLYWVVSVGDVGDSKRVLLAGLICAAYSVVFNSHFKPIHLPTTLFKKPNTRVMLISPKNEEVQTSYKSASTSEYTFFYKEASLTISETH